MSGWLVRGYVVPIDISVIIPARDAASVLGEQLEALVQQTWVGSWEVLVADNGSSDDTPQVALSFGPELPVTVVDASSGSGRAAACNLAAARARGEVLLFLDADDRAGPEYVAMMWSALAEHDFVAARLDCTALSPGWAGRVRSPAQVHGLGQGAYPYAYGASLGVRRRAFEHVGGFDESLRTAEDIDFCYRMALAGYRLTFVSDAVLAYRCRDTMREIWKQAYAYGVGGAEIRRRYAARGEPTPSWSRNVRTAASLTRSLVKDRNKESVGRWVYFLANRLGGAYGATQGRK